MPSPRDIRRRIRSISSTAQITKAMQMVAASKMRKAQQAALAGRPFAQLLYRIQRDATTHAGDFDHPLLEVREVRKRAVILVGTDKGLCGALNTNLFRVAAQFDPATTRLHHRRPQGRAVRRPHRPAAGRRVRLRRHPDVRRGAGDRRLRPRPVPQAGGGPGPGRRHALRQHADPGAGRRRVPAGGRDHGAEDPGRASPKRRWRPTATEFLFEPSPEACSATCSAHYLNIFIYQVLLNAKASEQSARMVSMKNATDNADGLIKDLTLEYNKLRQGNITKELLEIAGGQSD